MRMEPFPRTSLLQTVVSFQDSVNGASWYDNAGVFEHEMNRFRATAVGFSHAYDSSFQTFVDFSPLSARFGRLGENRNITDDFRFLYPLHYRCVVISKISPDLSGAPSPADETRGIPSNPRHIL